MRFFPPLLAFALGAISATAAASDPCAPPPTRPVHVAAFAAQVPTPDSTPATGSVIRTASSDELAVQAGCLAWERSHARQAEFIGTVPLGTAAPSGATVAVGSARSVYVPQAQPLPFFSSVIGPAPQEKTTAPETSGSFSLGVSLLGPR